MRLTYRASSGRITEREVVVLGLAFCGGEWIAACHCLRAGALRAFRLDQVLEAALGGAAPPHGTVFDARAFTAGSLAGPGPRPPERVAIRLAPPLATLAPALVPGLLELGPDGARVVHVRTARPEAALALALSLGRAAEPIHPPELARAARRLRGLLARP